MGKITHNLLKPRPHADGPESNAIPRKPAQRDPGGSV